MEPLAKPSKRPGLTPSRCPVRECGAWVYEVQLDGSAVRVDPMPVEVVVSDGETRFRLTTGYHPHSRTCVDISGRSR